MTKEEYRVSICPVCGHVRICHSSWHLVSFCCGSVQDETSENMINELMNYYKSYADLDEHYHEPILMNATSAYFTDEEVRIICGVDYVTKREYPIILEDED